MPGKRRKTQGSTYKKKHGKNYVRKDIPQEPKAVVCYCPQVCPDVMRVQVVYNTRKTIEGQSIVDLASFVFRGNGVFDPDFALGGQQPLGHDQWSAFYRRYRVLASRIDISPTSDSTSPAHMGVVPLATNSVLFNKDQYIESQYSKSISIGTDVSAKGPITLSAYQTVHGFRGAPKDLVRYEEDYTAVVFADPNKEFYWHVFGYGVGSAPNNFVIQAEIKITYYVEYYDRETLARS